MSVVINRTEKFAGNVYWFMQEPTGIPVHRDPGTGIRDFHPGPGSAGIAKNTGILNRDFINFFTPFEFLGSSIFCRKHRRNR